MKRGILDGKVIIVTGGSGLLGAAFINDIVDEGGIAINADVNGGNGEFIYTDITKNESIDELLKVVVEKYGKIDGIVNNAYPRTKDWGTTFEDISFESWRNNFDFQLNSYFYFTQKVLKYMNKSEIKGSIVNIASIYGVVGNDFSLYENLEMNPPAAYSAIKGGLINLSRYLASLYGKNGIRVNCVSPGGIFDHQPKEFVKRYEDKVPMKRMGAPIDIAPLTSFLLSEKSAYLTGQNICIDGGWTAI